MQRPRSAQTERLGVTETQLATLRLGWVFREQPVEDTGVDAHVEVVDDGQATRKLLALQIKGGESWFREPGPGGWWFRPDDSHVRYGTKHALPVAVVLWHPQTSSCYWQLVNEQTLVATSTGGRKLLVPRRRFWTRRRSAPSALLRQAIHTSFASASCNSRGRGCSPSPTATSWSSTSRSGSARAQGSVESPSGSTTASCRSRRAWRSGACCSGARATPRSCLGSSHGRTVPSQGLGK
jgi:hypothetical protein